MDVWVGTALLELLDVTPYGDGETAGDGALTMGEGTPGNSPYLCLNNSMFVVSASIN
jgi:hypothetical protein